MEINRGKIVVTGKVFTVRNLGDEGWEYGEMKRQKVHVSCAPVAQWLTGSILIGAYPMGGMANRIA